MTADGRHRKPCRLGRRFSWRRLRPPGPLIPLPLSIAFRESDYASFIAQRAGSAGRPGCRSFGDLLSSIALPKKPNYDFEKRKKEQDRKKKKDAKREERLQRKRPDGESADGGDQDQAAPADQNS